MAVFRVEKTRDYTVMANHHLRNKELSLKSKGLLSQMLSLPENWDYTLKGLSMINKESVDAIREAVKELEQAGYIIRTRKRNELGHLKGTEYTIFEKPHQIEDPEDDSQPDSDIPALEKPILEKPILENPNKENPTLENPMQLNINNKLNKDLLRKEVLSNHLSIPYQSIEHDARNDLIGLNVHSIKKTIHQNIEYDLIVDRFHKDRLDEIVDIMAETLCSKREYLTVAGDEYPADLVKEKLLRINSMHIEYVFECLNKNTTYIRNIKKYLLTTLFNAPSTIDSYYSALVNHDLYG